MHEVSSLRLLRVSENVRFKHDIIPWVIDERSDACVLANSPFLMSTLRGFTENCAERRCVSILLRFNPEASSDSCWVQQGGLSPVSIASPHFKCWKYLSFHFSWKVCHLSNTKIYSSSLPAILSLQQLHNQKEWGGLICISSVRQSDIMT